MTTTNLGRVQGGSFFFATDTSGTSVERTDLHPSTIPPLVGDHIIFPNGDIRKITVVGSTTITCDAVSANLRGPQGPLPTDAVHYDLETTETTEGVLLDGYYTKAQTLELIANAGSSKANINLNNVTVPSNTPGEITQGAGDRIVETYISSDGNTWYRRWASGWKECGLQNINSGAYAFNSYNLPLSFSSASSYQVVGCLNTEGNLQFAVRKESASAIGVANYGDHTAACSVYCCGY